MMIAAYSFSPGGSDYDRRKMYSTSTVLDINYWLTIAQYFNLNLGSTSEILRISSQSQRCGFLDRFFILVFGLFIITLDH